MNKFYSSTTGGFYPADMRTEYMAAGTWPADAKEIDEKEYSDLMSAQGAGAIISSDQDGLPTASMPPPITFADQAAPFMVGVRATRELILNRLPGMWMAAQAAGDTTTSTAIVNARQVLLDITKHPAVLAAEAAEDFTALRVAVKAAYKSITTAAPESVRSAFNMVDA